MNRLLISTASALAVMAGMAQAQAQDIDADDGEATALPAITVTANRTPTEMSKSGSKVEQVTKEEIEEKSFFSVTDYLTRLPGISVASNGGIGTTTGVFIRGLPSPYLKTYYNGIDVSDTTGTQVLTHYQYLLTGGVTGIEVLKGSQSTLYGSSAIAGLVDITTLDGIGEGINHTVHLEAGSFGTVRGRYGFTGASAGSRIAANVTGFRTDGISAFDGGAERDGYDNITFDLAAEHRINEAFSVFGSLLYIDATADFDDSWGDNPTNQAITEAMGGRLGFNLDLLDGRWKHTLSAQAFRMDRDSTDQPLLSTFIGTRQKLDYQSSFEATDRILLQYGADYERQVADTTTPEANWPPAIRVHARNSLDLTGIWAQAVVEPVDNLVLTTGLRHDEHSLFGGHTTWRGTASYLFDQTGTRLHSSFGTGFRAPSLYELYDPTYGNSTLKPETSRSFDIGVEQRFLDDRLTAGLTYFHIEVDNRIVSHPLTWQYVQEGERVRSQGLEASFAYAATSWLDIAGSYTYTDSRTASGIRSARVPKHSAVLSASVRPAEKWLVSADLKYVSGNVDHIFGTPPTVVGLKDYVLLNAKIAYQVTDSTEIYLRGENLLDQDYQTIRNYGTPGIAAYAGIKATF